jgi:hypothetical protein
MARVGRKPFNDHEAMVQARLPRALINLIEAYRDAELCRDRQEAIHELLELGLQGAANAR